MQDLSNLINYEIKVYSLYSSSPIYEGIATRSILSLLQSCHVYDTDYNAESCYTSIILEVPNG